MEGESMFDLILGSLIIGVVLAFFAFSKLGALDFLIGKKELPRLTTLQGRGIGRAVDHATVDEQHPNRSESRAPASKADTPE